MESRTFSTVTNPTVTISYPKKWPCELQRCISEQVDDEWTNVLERLQTHPQEARFIGKMFGQTPLHCACMRYPPVEAVRELLRLSTVDIASHQNKKGETPLHFSISLACTEEVQLAILEKAPVAVGLADEHGETPLHLAAAGDVTFPVLERLVRASPATVAQPDHHGRTPFSLLGTAYIHAESLEELEVDEMFTTAQGEEEEEEEEETDEYNEDDENDDCIEDWKAAKLFLKEAYQHACHRLYGEDGEPARKCAWLPQTQSFGWVHAAAMVPATPLVFLQQLTRFYPHHATWYDGNGMTPLLLACKAESATSIGGQRPGRGANRFDGADTDENENDNHVARYANGNVTRDEGQNTVHFLDGNSLPIDWRQLDQNGNVQSPGIVSLTDVREEGNGREHHNGETEQVDGPSSAIDQLVRCDPRSVRMACPKGRLPLTHALERGKCWADGIRALVSAAPQALESRDVETGFYPFQLAAVHCNDTETIFHLLRSFPQGVPQSCTSTKSTTVGFTNLSEEGRDAMKHVASSGLVKRETLKKRSKTSR